jgi:hypothetical protein
VPSGVAIGPNGMVYVAGGPSGIMTVDFSDLQRPDLQSVVEATGGAAVTCVAVSDGYLAAGTDRGVELFELSDPRRPSSMGTPLSGFRALALDYQHPRLYVAADTSGIVIVDASAPEQIQDIGGLSAVYPIYDVAAEQGLIYAAGAGVLALTESAVPVDPTEPPPSPSSPPIVPTATSRPSPSPTPTASPTPIMRRYYLPIVWIWR